MPDGKEQTLLGDMRATLPRTPGRALILRMRMASRETGIWDAVWSELQPFFCVANLDLQRLPAGEVDERPAADVRGDGGCLHVGCA
jgi:hypothetical protein